MTQTFAPTPTDEALARTFMEEGEARYLAFCQRRQLTLPSHGQWEVALVISGTASEIKPHNFLELIATLNPRLSGWPVWFDPRNMDRTQLPELNEGIWEALIVDFNNGVLGEYLDFMRLDPHGRFFLLRALDDDIYSRRGGPTPMKEFDAMIPIYKATEAIAVGQAFAKGMGYPLEGTTLSFMFKWTGLRGRTLTSWASQSFMLRSHRKSSQEEVESFVQVPLDAPISTVGNRVYQLLSPLYEAFEGFEQPEKFVADRVEKIINRKI
ncbi:MAG: hypothetical protein IPI55_15295 [Flavobacteriales bacterium]|nr:hypothetical protein [Flavobacteriales bacterium]